jgi:hypothetical protein
LSSTGCKQDRRIGGNETIWRNVNKGLPQGAVLSPILYALYTNNITNMIPRDIHVLQFADDIAVYKCSNNRASNRDRLEAAVNVTGENLSELGLSLEPRKTQLVEFTKTGYHDKGLFIRLGNEQVQNHNLAKFLGIWLDNELNFNKQIQEVRGKVSRANSILKYLSSVKRGIEVNTALMLYKSLVRSTVDYGCFVYAPRTCTAQLKIERGQFLGVRTALGYRNSTPNNVIIAEAKLTYLMDRALMLAKNFCLKV